MTDKNSLTPETVLTEAEHKRILAIVTADLRKDLDRANEKLRDMELRACIAEWAVAGILSRNLYVKVAMSDQDQRQRAVDIARDVGGNAGMQFLHAAELAFKEHAKHSELMTKIPPHEFYSHVAVPEQFKSGRSNWPRPFK